MVSGFDCTDVVNYQELPVALTVSEVQKVLRISRGGAYQLIHREDFPTVKIGRRYIIPRDKFIEWLEEQAGRNI